MKLYFTSGGLYTDGPIKIIRMTPGPDDLTHISWRRPPLRTFRNEHIILNKANFNGLRK